MRLVYNYLLFESGQAHEIVFDNNSSENMQFKEMVQNQRSLVEGGCRPRWQIELNVDFSVVYTLLFYLYTSELTVRSDYPDMAMDLYSLADYWAITHIQDEILRWFRLSCTPNNIVPRILHYFAKKHETVQKTYVKYLREDLDGVESFYRNGANLEDQERFYKLKNLVIVDPVQYPIDLAM